MKRSLQRKQIIFTFLFLKEIRRAQQLQAAERRVEQENSRGIKNPESVKRAQEKAAKLEALENKNPPSQQNLRWVQD